MGPNAGISDGEVLKSASIEALFVDSWKAINLGSLDLEIPFSFEYGSQVCIFYNVWQLQGWLE